MTEMELMDVYPLAYFPLFSPPLPTGSEVPQ